MVMTIWKWSLAHITMDKLLLKELLLSYNESYVPKVDVEGMIGVKKKKLQQEKTEGDLVLKFHFEDKEGAEQGILSWC
jgi:hypothetical protein